MSSRAFASLFSGGGIADRGARDAGLAAVHAVEYVPEIAAVYAANLGPHVLVADVTTLTAADFAAQPAAWWRHASPPCTNASRANTGARETEQDIAMAEAVCRMLRAQRPPWFSLENVTGYRDFESFKCIVREVYALGYAADWWLLNSADYGVPQTRKRLILVASRVARPRKPEPTHADPRKLARRAGQASLFGEPALAPWNGWYAAIEDLLPSCPESAFAPWQLERLPESLAGSFLLSSQSVAGGEAAARDASEPATAIEAQGSRGRLRAFLHMTGNTQIEHPTGTGILLPRDPANTVSAHSGGNGARAFLVSNAKTEWGDGLREGDEPAHAVTGEKIGRSRALLINGDNTRRDLSRRVETDPAFVVPAGGTKNPIRALLAAGRVVAMTPRCLARFQSVPDDYVLPERNGLACRIVGNGLSGLVMRAVIEAQG